MGICSSKEAGGTKGTPTASPTPPEEAAAKVEQAAVGTSTAAVAAAAADVTPVGRAVSEEYPRTPTSPLRTSEADDGKVHTYSSTEKPVRSAMRPSMEGRSPGQFSRKSSSGLSSVGFNVNINAPDAESSTSSFAGGNSISLKKIVDMFYDKVLADADLSPFFENIDMAKLKKHQVRFMGLAFGGKDLVFEEDPNLNLRKVHYRLIRDKGLSLDHWQKFVGLFEKTLNQLEKEIPEETRQAAKRSIHATKHYFVPIGQETEYTNSSIASLPVGEANDAEQQPQVAA